MAKNVSNPIDLQKMRALYNSVGNKTAFLEDTGLTLSALHYILKGKTLPTATTIAAFAAYFGIPCGALFSDYNSFRGDEAFDNCKGRFKHELVLKDAVLFYND